MESHRASPRSPPGARKRPGKLQEVGRNITSLNSARDAIQKERSHGRAHDRGQPHPSQSETPVSRASSVSRPEPVQTRTNGESDLLELAKGGEALMRRLADVNSVNGELRRKLEKQSHEISLLEESGRAQQQLFRDLEYRVEQTRQAEAAKVRQSCAEREAQLQKELEECREQAQKDREELMERLHQCDSERAQREGERDEARVQVTNLEARINALAHEMPNMPSMPSMPSVAFKAPQAMGDAGEGSRVAALEMELNLVRSRFARETVMRQAAEKTAQEVQLKQRQLHSQLEQSRAELARLHRDLAQRSEQVSFGQECCQDLQMRLRHEQNQSEQRLQRERGRFAVVSRLEGVLPKHVLMKALA